MKYEVRAKSLAQAIAASVRNGKVPLQKKSSETIDAGEGGNYNYTTMDVDVERGFSYTISWSAHKDAGEGADYGIKIRSHDGHPNHTEAFYSSGSMPFTAKTSGTISFSIGVSYSAASLFGRYPVDLDID